MSKKYVVRVVQTMDKEGNEVNGGGTINDALLDNLRYAGLIKCHETDPNGLTIRCFDIYPPHGVVTKVWSEQLAERMKSFGFNAVSAPSTR